MAIHITASGAQNIGPARAIRIQNNKDLTGTITVTAAGSTQYGTSSSTVAVITNPTAVAAAYEYGGLHTQGDISINPSGTCDVTVTKINQAG